MHVPKCGGSSLTNSLIEATASKCILVGHDLSLFGEFADFDSLDPAIRDMIYTDQPPDEAFDFVRGHMALSTLKRWFPNARRITLLRHPAARLISFYLFWRSMPEQELQRRGRWSTRVRLTHGPLLDFLFAKEIACQTDNLLARLLLWPHPHIPDNDFIDISRHEILFREARRKLEDFEFVDILENPRLEENIGNWLMRSFKLRRDNETVVREDLMIDLRTEFNEATERRLKSLTAIDSRLWTIYAEKAGLASDCRSWAEDLWSNYKLRATRLWAPGEPMDVQPTDTLFQGRPAP